jgi:hypothetical protein
MAKKAEEKAKPAPKKKEEKKVVDKNKKQPEAVPFFLETTFTVSKAIVVITAGLVAVLSILSGCPAIWIVARTAAAILSVGFILWLINWFVAKGTLDAEIAKLKEEDEKATTMELKA